MACGLVQMQAFGQENFFLNAKPTRLFFSRTPEEMSRNGTNTHPHFARESYRVEFQREDADFDRPTYLVTRLDKHADLVTHVTLHVDLPDLWALRRPANGSGGGGGIDRVRWVRRLGEMLVESFWVTVGSTVVEVQDGEWMWIKGELSMPAGKRPNYASMIGDVPVMYDPDSITRRFYTEDDRRAGVAQPFVRGRGLAVPLTFWFSSSTRDALNLAALKYDDVLVHVRLRPIRHLYQVRLADGRSPGVGYVAPRYADVGPGAAAADDHLGRFMAPEEAHRLLRSNVSINLSPRLQVTYVHLEDKERREVTLPSAARYLFDRLTRIDRYGLAPGRVVVLDLELRHAVREVVFFARRRSAAEQNAWTDVLTRDGRPMIVEAALMLNGSRCMDLTPNVFFSGVQVHQHHAGSPAPDAGGNGGILVYSFALRPDETAPSGSCNMSMVTAVQLQLRLAECAEVDEEVDVTVFATAHNFFVCESGHGDLLFRL
jgi:Large eukaryotic DNA virus major capsid protein/Major capsid protein N-terminus